MNPYFKTSHRCKSCVPTPCEEIKVCVTVSSLSPLILLPQRLQFLLSLQDGNPITHATRSPRPPQFQDGRLGLLSGRSDTPLPRLHHAQDAASGALALGQATGSPIQEPRSTSVLLLPRDPLRVPAHGRIAVFPAATRRLVDRHFGLLQQRIAPMSTGSNELPFF